MAGKLCSSLAGPIRMQLTILASIRFDRRSSPHARRDLPNAFLDLLESLVNVNPFARPSASEVLETVRQMRGLPSPRSKPRRPTHSPRTSKFTEMSSEALIPRQNSPPRAAMKLPSPVHPTAVSLLHTGSVPSLIADSLVIGFAGHKTAMGSSAPESQIK